jgi:hypothetical protein
MRLRLLLVNVIENRCRRPRRRRSSIFSIQKIKMYLEHIQKINATAIIIGECDREQVKWL